MGQLVRFTSPGRVEVVDFEETPICAGQATAWTQS